MRCKNCKWFVPTKFAVWNTIEKYGRNIIKEENVGESLEDFNHRLGYNITKGEEYSNYGRCTNRNKLKAAEFQNEEFINTDDQALFVDAGECPDLFVGVNFGCVHFESKDVQNPYGWCPHCGSPCKERERRPNGNDKCQIDHVYPSKSAIMDEDEARQITISYGLKPR